MPGSAGVVRFLGSSKVSGRSSSSESYASDGLLLGHATLGFLEGKLREGGKATGAGGRARGKVADDDENEEEEEEDRQALGNHRWE
mmetsp:Transcript_38883/g.122527  ORF Transcript_38883/g.122527 Transcript_38883/m.122527 type:complete len:86 (+) Transcript_38883:169-426(+)